MLTKQINRLRLLALAAVLAGLLLSGCAGRSPAAHTITFLDENAAVLSVQTVVHGQDAAAPAVSDSAGHIFAGWDGDFRCVTEDLTLTAQYIPSQDPTLFVPQAAGSAGKTVLLPVKIVNNPGIAGAKITLVYDPALTLSGAKCGDALSQLDYTEPGRYASPCSFTWDSEHGTADDDGAMVWLTFTLPADAASGRRYAVNCIYQEGDIFDEALNDVAFETINGGITVN